MSDLFDLFSNLPEGDEVGKSKVSKELISREAIVEVTKRSDEFKRKAKIKSPQASLGLPDELGINRIDEKLFLKALLCGYMLIDYYSAKICSKTEPVYMLEMNMEGFGHIIAYCVRLKPVYE